MSATPEGEETRWATLLTAWLRKVWDEWDVRILVLLSLFLQSILLIFGKRRKYTKCDLCRNILWFAYLMADWVAIFALGKLSTAQEVSAPSFILRSLWAPLLLLHLGGADTITSYEYEDNQLWNRHLLTLIVKSTLAVYVIYLSWTKQVIWVSVLTIPLMLAGTIKYVERILCLHLSFTGQSGRAVQLQYADIPPEFYENNREVLSVAVAFIWFAAMRPDANNYISLRSAAQRFNFYLTQNGIYRRDVHFYTRRLFNVLWKVDTEEVASYQLATIQLGFMFDVVHTKAAIIYTKLGGILRILSFCGSCCVSVLFLVRLTEVSKYHFSPADTFITSVLLAGSVALELYAAWLIVSSDWALLLMLRFFKKVPRLLSKLMLKKRRWADRMGQFDLVSYCLKHRKENKKKSSMFGSVFDFSRHWHTQYAGVPKELTVDDLLEPFLRSGYGGGSNSRASRGIIGIFQKGQNLHPSLDELGFDEMEIDQIIIIWHIVTKVFYEVDHLRHATLSTKIQGDEEEGRLRDSHVDIIGDMELSKKISDYIMYLLVRRSSMLLPNYSRNFWLDIAIDHLKDLLKDVDEEAKNIDVAAALMLLQPAVDNPDECSDSDDGEFRIIEEDPMRYAQKVIKCLVDEASNSRWKSIRWLWTEILVFAAASCQHANHIHELKRGSELLTAIWLMEFWVDLADKLYK